MERQPKIYVNGSYIDIHDNENVYLDVDKDKVKTAVRDKVKETKADTTNNSAKTDTTNNSTKVDATNDATNYNATDDATHEKQTTGASKKTAANPEEEVSSETLVRLKNAIDTMRKEGKFLKSDFTYTMLAATMKPLKLPFFTSGSYIKELKLAKVEDIPDRSTIDCVLRTMENRYAEIDDWKFKGKDESETTRRKLIAKRFMALMVKGE